MGVRIQTFFKHLQSFNNQVTTDKQRVQQIVLSLVKNALKYTETGFIRIKVKPYFDFDIKRWRLKIQVRDTGTGIKKADVLKLFKIFGTADQPQNSHSGIGLGLVICKYIV